MLGATVAAVLAGNKGEVIGSATATFFGGDLPPRVVTPPPRTEYLFASTTTAAREARWLRCNTESTLKTP